MGTVTAADLDGVSSFSQLVALLRDKLDWPIGDDYGFDDVVFEYEASELGLKEADAAKIREIHQLRPLATHQPWGVFFISMEDKALPVTVLRRILKALVVKKRSGSGDRRAWDKSDLIFAASFGRSGARELAFVHFSDASDTGDLPVLKVLGWNARDTRLHNAYVARQLQEKLAWPDDPSNARAWRETWASAFELRVNQAIRTSKDLATRLAGLASEIRARVNELLGAEADAGPMRTMLTAFRKNLIHDLDEDGFADMFAQTIAYGMLAARMSRPMSIIADNLADMVPKTNPFLKELFGTFLKIGGRDKRRGLDFDELGVRDVVDVLNAANMEAVLRDFGDRTPKEDPVIHFYELFLKEYDPKKRMQRGVFYTPRPVVNFIVRGVDEILRAEFGLSLGLADTSTWAEVAALNDRITIPAHVKPDAPFVQILDPATGTGTFLVEVIDLIHKRMEEHWKAQGKSAAEIKAAWNSYVPAHLLPRLTAFELMMAPYTIAHMKVGLKLSETGYAFGSEERARIFLTNALEPARDLDMEFIFMSEALAHEAQASNDAKARTPFTVVVGNPPYAGFSSNISAFAESLIDKYRYIEGVALGEKRSWLQNDYVKFHGLASSYLSRLGFGVFGMITDNSYVDGPTFRGLRAGWLSVSTKSFVFDLAGKATIVDERSQGRDENIFEIGQGTAILISAIGNNQSAFENCNVAVMHGTVDDKLDHLSASSLTRAGFRKGFPRTPHFEFFSQPLSEVETEYEKFGAITDFVGLKCVGVQTSRDPLAIAIDEQDFDRKIRHFCLAPIEEVREEYFREITKSKYPRGDTRQWTVGGTRSQVIKRNFVVPLARIAYRPFDIRVFASTTILSDWPRPELLAEASEGNPILSILRRTENKRDYDYVFVSQEVPWNHHVSIKDGAYGIPLWLKPSAGEPHRRPNIDRTWAMDFGKSLGLTYEDGIPRGEQKSFGPDFKRSKAEQLGLLGPPWDGRGDLEKTFGPRDLFDYIYAVLHSPGYRSRYAEFLKSAFPRIPTPRTRATFAALAALGRQLVGMHLLRPEDAPILKTPDIRFAGNGEARVEKGHPHYENGKVMINANRWFEDVPAATWAFHVGGYQVCEKWLKDRAGKGGKNPGPGRVLTNDDILHYRRVVVALTETRRLMAEIDEVITRHGGWPDAFTGMGETSLSSLKTEIGKPKSAAAEERISKPHGSAAVPLLEALPNQRQSSSADLDRDELMPFIRQALSHGVAETREEVMRRLLPQLGGSRLGPRLRETLDDAIRTAVRRGIAHSDNGRFSLLARSLAEYDRDFLKEQFLASLEGRAWRERDEAIKAFGRWMGFRRTGETIDETARSLINGLIRDSRLETERDRIRRSG